MAKMKRREREREREWLRRAPTALNARRAAALTLLGLVLALRTPPRRPGVQSPPGQLDPVSLFSTSFFCLSFFSSPTTCPVSLSFCLSSQKDAVFLSIPSCPLSFRRHAGPSPDVNKPPPRETPLVLSGPGSFISGY